MLNRLENMGAEVEDTLKRLMGDQEMYLEYLKLFPENENIIKLRQAVDAKDADAAAREAHTLKGVALNLGLLPIADVCMDMLLDFREGNPEEAMRQIDDVEACFNEWKAAIVK